MLLLVGFAAAAASNLGPPSQLLGGDDGVQRRRVSAGILGVHVESGSGSVDFVTNDVAVGQRRLIGCFC